MRYTQLVIGFLVGTALGGSVIAGTGIAPTGAGATATDSESIKKIVREVIAQEPQLILDSVQKFQVEEQKKQSADAGQALNDKDVYDKLYNNPNTASYGPKDTKHVVVEFFDYNCPVCKVMFKSLDTLAKKDKTLRILFVEYPIFGAVSDMNSKLGLAVHRLHPEKYYAFHEKMMGVEGHGPGNNEPTLAFIKELGMDVEKVKAEANSPEVAAILDDNRKLGAKLHVQGTPLLVIGGEIIPHAMGLEELESRVNAIK
ncbi:MAG: DsbA family protein [Alphaproteobacteria bacterium]|nr:DsbA family protein [Alphaproteobacteria bacterium]